MNLELDKLYHRTNNIVKSIIKSSKNNQIFFIDENDQIFI